MWFKLYSSWCMTYKYNVFFSNTLPRLCTPVYIKNIESKYYSSGTHRVHYGKGSVCFSDVHIYQPTHLLHQLLYTVCWMLILVLKCFVIVVVYYRSFSVPDLSFSLHHRTISIRSCNSSFSWHMLTSKSLVTPLCDCRSWKILIFLSLCKVVYTYYTKSSRTMDIKYFS